MQSIFFLMVSIFFFRFLATGESFRSMAFSYRISPSAISKFVPIVLKALKTNLQPTFLPPVSQINWKEKAEEFWHRWNFPNCLAGLDGKHVRIVAPDNTGSLFHNYKNYFSIVLLAMVDARYKFVGIDVGSYGKEGDAGIFNKSEMGKQITKGNFFPPPRFLPGSNILLPHVIVGDEAFRLDKHVMKPYCRKQAVQDGDKKRFNYHLCRARRVTENAFGIMCSIFRIFFTPINVKAETVDLIIWVCCCLHNYLREESLDRCAPFSQAEDTHELPKDNMIPLPGVGGFANSEGFEVRAQFKDYFRNRRRNE